MRSLEHAAHRFEAEHGAVVGLDVAMVAQREHALEVALESLGEGRAGEDGEVERADDAGVLRTTR